MKSIAKHYPGVDPRATKIPLYRVLFDAMNDNQECQVCGSKCNPATHVFQPVALPPESWVMGPDGLYIPPDPSQPGISTQQSRAPPSSLPPLQTSTSQSTTPGQHVRTHSPTRGLLRPKGSQDLFAGSGATPLINDVVQQPPGDVNVANLVGAGSQQRNSGRPHLGNNLHYFTSQSGFDSAHAATAVGKTAPAAARGRVAEKTVRGSQTPAAAS